MPKRKPNVARGRDGRHDWAKQMRFDMEYAKDCLLRTGQVRPMFVIHSPVGLIPVMTDMGDKPNIRRIVALMCIAHDAIGLVFIGEAWMVETNQPDDKQRPGESLGEWEERIGVPSESDRRVEIVTVQSAFYDDATGDRSGLIEMRVIERGDDGKPSGLGRVIGHKHGADPNEQIKGPTFTILPERRSATPQQRELAKQALEMLGVKPIKPETWH
jgi:hypothetical protein